MNRVTATILSLALAASGAFCADPPGEKPKEKTPAEVLYEKLLEANTKEADKAYAAYLKALEVANGKILAGLEAAKKDMNDPKKGKLSIVERAAAIAEIDKKIGEVKRGAVGEAVVSARSVDLLDGGVDIAKDIVGKWNTADGNIRWEFNSNGSGIHFAMGTKQQIPFSWAVINGSVSINGVGRVRSIVLMESGAIEDGSIKLYK